MAGSMERVLSPEEVELQKYLDEIERLKSDIAAKLADLEAYKVELARFSAEYHAVLGPLFVELERLELGIAEYRRKIDLVHSQPQLSSQEIDQTVDHEFRARRERIHQEEEEFHKYQETWEQEKKRPKLSMSDEAELKSVYRELAKKHHPDFAADEEDRTKRQSMMQRINAAYEARDVEALRDFKDGPGHSALPAGLSIGERLVWAIRYLARLRDRLNEVAQDLKRVTSDKLAELLRQRQVGSDPVTRIASELRYQIVNRRETLTHLQSTYRSLQNR